MNSRLRCIVGIKVQKCKESGDIMRSFRIDKETADRVIAECGNIQNEKIPNFTRA